MKIVRYINGKQINKPLGENLIVKSPAISKAVAEVNRELYAEGSESFKHKGLTFDE